MRPHQPTPTPHMKGYNRRQRETRPLQSPRRRSHQPTPTPHIKGDNRRQWETTGDKTTSEPKKPTTPTNTKAARSKVALRTLTVNCLGNKKIKLNFRALQCPSDRVLHAWVQKVTKCGIKFDKRANQRPVHSRHARFHAKAVAGQWQVVGRPHLEAVYGMSRQSCDDLQPNKPPER